MAEKKRAVLISRDILNVGDDHAVVLFMWLIAHANRDAKPYPYRTTHPVTKAAVTLDLAKNQAFICVTSYAKARGLSPKVVRTRLDQLKRRESIGMHEVHQLGIIVTVANLDYWQTFGNYTNGPGSTREALGRADGKPYHVDNHEKTSRGKPRADQRFSTTVLELVDSQTEKSAGSLAMLYNKLLDAYSKAEVIAAYDAAKAGGKRFNGHDEAWAWFKTECRAIRTRGVAPVPQYDIVNGERQ